MLLESSAERIYNLEQELEFVEAGLQDAKLHCLHYIDYAETLEESLYVLAMNSNRKQAEISRMYDMLSRIPAWVRRLFGVKINIRVYTF